VAVAVTLASVVNKRRGRTRGWEGTKRRRVVSIGTSRRSVKAPRYLLNPMTVPLT
jgi:hypothetical protein